MPFHQIMRSTCPVFTVLIYRVVYSQRYETAVYLSLIPMVLGIGMVTYGDYYFTARGFILTALGVVLASIKVRKIIYIYKPSSDTNLNMC